MPLIGRLRHPGVDVPEGMPCIVFPLAPQTAFTPWDDVMRTAVPLPGHPARKPEDLAMIIYASGSTGQRKDVMLRFRAVTAAATGLTKDLEDRFGARRE